MNDTADCCSTCSRLTGFGDEERFEPPVNLARCPSPGGLECRAVAQAVAPLRRENEVLRCYQRNSMEADERLRAVRRLLEWNGCECECEHHWEDHDDDCDRCLACRIGEAVGK